MITFRKFAAASDGKLVRMYFTEARLGPPPPEQATEALGQQQLEPGSRLTSYYTGRDAGPAWRADMPLSVARALGINSHHAPKDEELDRLFEGKRADTGEAWSKHKREISGYDFTFSPHKSVTLAAEFAQDPAEAAAIRNAIYRANDAAMRYVAREIGWARRGRAGKSGADPGAVGWVSFKHYIARPTLPVQDGREGATYLLEAPIAGDPHDHIHNALFNLVVTGEGHIGSLDTQRLHARVHEFGAFAQAVLADELRALGIRVAYDEKEQAAVILAIPQFANEAFSKSTHQVLRNAKAFAAGQGLDWDDISAEKKAEILREAAAAARLAKHGEKTDHKIWRDQAEAMGWEHSTVMEDARIAALSNEERIERAYAFAAKHLAEEFHTAAVIDHDRLRIHAARGLIGVGVAGGVKDIDRVVEQIERKGVDLHGEHVDLVAAWAKRENPEDEPRLRIPTQSGRGFRFDPGRRSDLKSATIPN
ncbi:relaxase domain-containing protein [Methylosinus sp. H3A]|uniref:MobF family relaxase n=1 Tax=Methylosinus sp. H3A TaxID=2785786 RepID=UPI0018C30EF4|nr:MobF family relaxase [Methylosinus sp. H3A]MBG0808104.1 relaxase domain-containing protein [Methylosinus sp. H3A]